MTMLVALGDGAGARAWTVVADDGRAFAVFRLADGALRVCAAACPHRGGPLAEGIQREAGDDATTATVACPWHWYRYSLDTGRCLTAPRYALDVYPVVEHDGGPHADVGEAPPELSWSERLRAHARGES